MLDLYKNIRSLREQNGWSQDELAEKVGYKDRSMIAKIENGEVDLKRSKILAFADIFGVTPAYLMGWDTSNCDLQLSLLERQLVLAYRQADTVTQSNILKLLDVPAQEAESRVG